VLLTSSDLALSLLIGLPIGTRLTFEKQLRGNRYLRFYTEEICFLLFEYLFILRVIIVAVISAEKCFHILLPFKYKLIATEWKVKVASWVLVILPLLRTVPLIYLLVKYDAVVHCCYYNDDFTNSSDSTSSIDKHYAPLTCKIDGVQLTAFSSADVSFIGILVVTSWLVIVLSNFFILVLILKMTYFTHQHRAVSDLNPVRSGIMVILISLSFASTNFPFAYTWISRIISEEENYEQHFYLILLSFFSLIFHPWLYCMRLRNIRDLTTPFTSAIKERAKRTSLRVSNGLGRISTKKFSEVRLK
jgi:hypothetical protein